MDNEGERLENGQDSPAEKSEDWYFDLPDGAWERQERKNRDLRRTLLHKQGMEREEERADPDPTAQKKKHRWFGRDEAERESGVEDAMAGDDGPRFVRLSDESREERRARLEAMRADEDDADGWSTDAEDAIATPQDPRHKPLLRRVRSDEERHAFDHVDDEPVSRWDAMFGSGLQEGSIIEGMREWAAAGHHDSADEDRPEARHAEQPAETNDDESAWSPAAETEEPGLEPVSFRNYPYAPDVDEAVQEFDAELEVESAPGEVESVESYGWEEEDGVEESGAAMPVVEEAIAFGAELDAAAREAEEAEGIEGKPKKRSFFKRLFGRGGDAGTAEEEEDTLAAAEGEWLPSPEDRDGDAGSIDFEQDEEAASASGEVSDDEYEWVPASELTEAAGDAGTSGEPVAELDEHEPGRETFAWETPSDDDESAAGVAWEPVEATGEEAAATTEASEPAHAPQDGETGDDEAAVEAAAAGNEWQEAFGAEETEDATAWAFEERSDVTPGQDEAPVEPATAEETHALHARSHRKIDTSWMAAPGSTARDAEAWAPRNATSGQPPVAPEPPNEPRFEPASLSDQSGDDDIWAAFASEANESEPEETAGGGEVEAGAWEQPAPDEESPASEWLFGAGAHDNTDANDDEAAWSPVTATAGEDHGAPPAEAEGATNLDWEPSPVEGAEDKDAEHNLAGTFDFEAWDRASADANVEPHTLEEPAAATVREDGAGEWQPAGPAEVPPGGEGEALPDEAHASNWLTVREPEEVEPGDSPKDPSFGDEPSADVTMAGMGQQEPAGEVPGGQEKQEETPIEAQLDWEAVEDDPAGHQEDPSAWDDVFGPERETSTGQPFEAAQPVDDEERWEPAVASFEEPGGANDQDGAPERRAGEWFTAALDSDEEPDVTGDLMATWRDEERTAADDSEVETQASAAGPEDDDRAGDEAAATVPAWRTWDPDIGSRSREAALESNSASHEAQDNPWDAFGSFGQPDEEQAAEEAESGEGAGIASAETAAPVASSTTDDAEVPGDSTDAPGWSTWDPNLASGSSQAAQEPESLASATGDDDPWASFGADEPGAHSTAGEEPAAEPHGDSDEDSEAWAAIVAASGYDESDDESPPPTFGGALSSFGVREEKNNWLAENFPDEEPEPSPAELAAAEREDDVDMERDLVLRAFEAHAASEIDEPDEPLEPGAFQQLFGDEADSIVEDMIEPEPEQSFARMRLAPQKSAVTWDDEEDWLAPEDEDDGDGERAAPTPQPEFDPESVPFVAATSTRNAEAAKRTRTWIRELVETGLLALLVFLSVRASFQNFKVDGSSMYPTLENGQFLIVNKLVYSEVDMDKLNNVLPFISAGDEAKRHVFHGPERGDIIVLQDPSNPKVDLIKRVVGLPGEKLEIVNGAIYINDQRLIEPYIKQPWHDNRPAMIIPDGAYFVMGDNRDNSKDSRSPSIGFIPEELIIGRAELSYLPLSAFGLIGNGGASISEKDGRPTLSSELRPGAAAAAAIAVAP